MSKIVFITGGARSGKSAFAETYVLKSGKDPVYIATAQAGDAEMQTRIDQHKQRRGDGWSTLEAPFDLEGVLLKSDGSGPRLVDCLTLWLSNMMLADKDYEAAALGLLKVLEHQQSPVFLVSNEVGCGIVPENALARRFRDAAGRLNQQIAARADEVYMVISGLPLCLKPQENRSPNVL